MISFILCLAIIVCGYMTYGKVVDNAFAPDDRETPAVAINDGVDFVVLPQWKLFLVQLLNIAGLGPIFGAITGAEWGPVVYLWITFGTIFAGAVHDYLSGMLSERENGASISEVTGDYLGQTMKNIMRVFAVILLIMTGTVFAVGPAGLLKTLFANSGVQGGILVNATFWLALILIYYFIATFISIDKIIGRIYPVFGICLIIMAIGVGCGTLLKQGGNMPELFTHFYNMHPKGKAIWSYMFITVACGACSGFHSTQSPLMARCLKSERQGHFVFYGAMVAEGIIALIWAAAANTWYDKAALLEAGGGNSTTVYSMCTQTMGGVGVVLAMLGVIACPITSGDTAFRSARYTIADWFKIDMGSTKNRFLLTLPVLGIGAILGFGQTFGVLDYNVIWNYFAWSNQTLAMLVLWAGAVYLHKNGKNDKIAVVPATFMSAVTFTYFMMAKETMGKIPALLDNHAVSYPCGIIFAIACLALYFKKMKDFDRQGAKA